MALTLYYHPLSSFCWKALIALYEMDIPFERHVLDLGDDAQREQFLARWPAGKMPMLQDGGTCVPESSIIIEYLSRGYADAERSLMPADAHACLEARLMDRVLDLYVMLPMQAIVADRLRAERDRDPVAVSKARDTLVMAYGLLERKLEGRTWMAPGRFSLADCAAAPSLFYATTLVPLAPGQERLGRYIGRVLERPSVARVLDEARPYFRFYPFREALPARYLEPVTP
jgi:glutathione S-transferase